MKIIILPINKTGLVRYISYLLIIICIFFTASCQRNQQNRPGKGLTVLSGVDINNAKAVYLQIKDSSPEIIDTAYTYLLQHIYDSDKMDLLKSHISYYQLLSGNRKYAASMIFKYKGCIYSFTASYDSADYFFAKAASLYNDTKDKKNMADCYFGIAADARCKGDYKTAVDNNYYALTILDKTKDSDYIYKVRTELAIDYDHLRDTAKAVGMIQSCIDYYQTHTDTLALLYAQSILSNIYVTENDYNKALEYAHTTLAARQRLGDKKSEAESLNNVAVIYLRLQQWDKAFSYFNQSLVILRDLNAQVQVPVVEMNIANCLWRMGKKEEAEKMVLRTIDTAAQEKAENIVKHGYMLLYGFNKENKNYKAALEYYEHYKVYNDSLFNADKQKTIDELGVKYETSKKEAQIIQLTNAQKIDAAKKLVYLLIAVFTVIIAILVILSLSVRNKKNKLVIEKANLELQANARELNYFTESIISKNKIIEDLETKLEKTAHQQIVINEDNEQLSQLYQLKILTEEDWQQFKILFDKVYPGFINRLREKYPELTPAEERQFFLIKLNIDTKECANMLGISIQSVKKNRYRLKKRFNLSEQDDLDVFVKQFG